MGWFRRSEHPEEQLSAYIDGELGGRQAEAVARHLTACPQCSEALEELRGTKTMLSVLPREAPSRSFVLGPEHARPAAPARAQPRRSSFSFAPAVAATLLIGLLLVDAINLQGGSNDESASNGFAGAGKTELSRQTAEDSASGAPGPAIASDQPATGTANSSAAAESATTPAATRAGAADNASGGSTAPTAPAVQPQASVPPPATGESAPAPTGPLSTFAADQQAPQPEQDGDAIAEAANPADDGGKLSTLRVLQILAGLAFVGSVFYVYVRPRLFERK
jgi:anti-sigma factor RsiW